MPWYIVRGGRLPVADEEVFATEDAAASACRRYPGSDCALVEAPNVIEALRRVIDSQVASPATRRVAPRFRVQRDAG